MDSAEVFQLPLADQKRAIFKNIQLQFITNFKVTRSHITKEVAA